WSEQSPIGVAVEASGEYDGSEPRERRARSLQAAVHAFRACFGRPPASFCPPDYRFDEWLEGEAARLGLTILQGGAEQVGRALPPVRRRLLGLRFPQRESLLFRMPPRIAFEPAGDAAARGRRGLDAAHRAARAAWDAGR